MVNGLKVGDLDDEEAEVRILYADNLVEANELMIEYMFPWADGVMTKPSGDMAYDIGWNLFIFQGDDSNIEVKGKYLAVMNKINGKWKISALSFSNDQPAK